MVKFFYLVSCLLKAVFKKINIAAGAMFFVFNIMLSRIFRLK